MDQPVPPPAVEQQAPVAAQPPVAEEPSALTDDELAKLADQAGKEETITVTGSLIGRKEVDSPSPVSVVDKEKLEAAGITNVGDILQKIPAQGNAINAQNNNGGDGAVRINLRSLGTARTLVLMNGRRVVPSGTGADSSVDFGTIPLAMIERVEVLKDGASAIYGSDAVAGVVNVITRSNFNGTEASLYTGTSQKGDGNNYDLSFVTGHSSTKGNVMFAGGYQEQEAVMAGDRDFASKTYSYSFCTESKRAAGECHTTKTLSGSPSGVTGRINSRPNGGPALTIPGCSSQFCTADGQGGFRNFMAPDGESLGDNYNFQPLNYVFTPSTRINLFSTGGYDISKYVHAFYEGQFNSRKSTQQLAAEPVTLSATGTTIAADNFYNPFGTEVLGYQRRFAEFGPRTSSQEINTARLVVGLNGSVPDTAPVAQNWRWEASYNYGRSNSTQTNGGNIIVSHLRNALGPTFMGADGEPHCGTSSADEPEGCVPLSILTPNTVTPEMMNYLKYTGIRSGFNEQHTALATVSGKVIDLPNHGDISIAFGGDFRKEEGGDQPDPLTATGDTTGNSSVPTRGNYHVFEGFGELSIVPVSGLKYAKWVEIDAAARAYKYNTFGSGVTGKLSGLFRTVGGLAVRGTIGTLFRAPNVSELYAGASDSFPLAEDPCDSDRPSTKVSNPTIKANCLRLSGVPDGLSFASSQQRAKLSGNKDLTAEKGNVATAGVVYEPEPIPGLGVTLDYWRININNAIQTLPVGQILSQCYQAGLQEFCDLIQRNPQSLEIDYIFDTITNVGSLNTSGLDFAATYQYRTNYGTFRHALEGTYLFKYNINTGSADTVIHGRNFYDLGVNPDLKANLFTTWVHPSGIGAGFTARFVNRFYECDENNCNDVENGRRRVPRYATGDLFVNYSTKTSQGKTTVSVGMNNVVDAKPPVIYQGSALNSDESAYDFMGRQIYVRLSQLF